MNAGFDRLTDAIRYRACGLVLISDMPLPELSPANGPDPGTEPCVRIRLAAKARRGSPSHWFRSSTLSTGETWLSYAREAGGYRLRFPEFADFRIDSGGLEIVCDPGPQTPLPTVRHLLLDHVLPLVLNLLGRQALHATAVLTPHGVCAFAGPTGAGKSTLAASFQLAGYQVLSDDCLVLEEHGGTILATPAYPGIRLWEDALEALGEALHAARPVAHYTSKQRVFAAGDAEGFPLHPVPVARIYFLHRPAEMQPADGPDEPGLEGISQRQGFMELIGSTFWLDIADRAMLVREFRFLEQLVSSVPLRRLRTPDSFSSLPAVRELVLDDLRRR